MNYLFGSRDCANNVTDISTEESVVDPSLCSFSLNVALIGTKSSGKTTLVNALLGRNYLKHSISASRETVNVIRVADPDKDPRPFSSTSPIENLVNVKIEEEIIEMRKDTNLVFFDVPGLKLSLPVGAPPVCKFSEYVEKNWMNFDCIVVVMDASKSYAELEQETDFMMTRLRNWQRRKPVPMLLLFNKSDCKPAARRHAQELERRFEEELSMFSSIVTSLSAQEAYYCSVCKCTRSSEELTTALEEAELEDFYAAISGVSKKTIEEKADELFKKCINQEKISVLYESSKLGDFISAFNRAAGNGENAQHAILVQQFNLKLRGFTAATANKERFEEIHNLAMALGGKSDPDSYASLSKKLSNQFWTVFIGSKRDAINAAKSEANPFLWERPLRLLLMYKEFLDGMDVCEGCWSNGYKTVLRQLEGMVGSQLANIINQAEEWDVDAWEEFEKRKRESQRKSTKRVRQHLHWKHVSPEDWFTIFHSLGLLANFDCFRYSFPGKLLKIEELKIVFQNIKASTHDDEDEHKINVALETKGVFTRDSFCPNNREAFASLSRFSPLLEGTPKTEKERGHWAHLAYEFCKLHSPEK